MSNRRASATMPMRRMRRPPPAKRLWYHWLRALLGWKRHPRQALSTPPPPQEPATGRPDLPQAHQLHDAALGIGLRFVQPLAALGLKRGDLALDQRKALYLAVKLAAHLPGQRTPVPQGERLQSQLRGVLAHHPSALHHQQRLHTHPMRKPLTLQALQFTV